MSTTEQPDCADCGLTLHPQAEKAIGTGEWASVWADSDGGWVCAKTGDEHDPSTDGPRLDTALVVRLTGEGHSQMLVVFRNGHVFRRTAESGHVSRWRYTEVANLTEWTLGFTSLSGAAPVPAYVDRVVEMRVTDKEATAETWPTSLTRPLRAAMAKADATSQEPPADLRAVLEEWVGRSQPTSTEPGPGTHIVIEGNPVDGFVFHGIPAFTDASEASEWAGDNCTQEWWTVPLQDVDA